MVTEHTNTVYECAVCGRPAAISIWNIWQHCAKNTGCQSLTVVPVRLTLPTPRSA